MRTIESENALFWPDRVSRGEGQRGRGEREEEGERERAFAIIFHGEGRCREARRKDLLRSIGSRKRKELRFCSNSLMVSIAERKLQICQIFQLVKAMHGLSSWYFAAAFFASYQLLPHLLPGAVRLG